tara:strand:+ start:7308 stop:9785 length:2478 start_codon:yes stop_codon:yes gene_type:complete
MFVGIGSTPASTPGFQEYKDTLPKEPVGNVKKRYVVTCNEPRDWTDIHQLLLKDGTLEDNIPNYGVECSDNKLHSSTRGTYILDDNEASDLSKHAKVKTIHIDAASYPGTYMPDPALLMDAVRVPRYGSNIKNYRGSASSNLPATPTAADSNRAGYQLLRGESKLNQWQNSVSTIISDNPESYGDGKDVDVIVADQAAWLGHIEFQNNTGNSPTNYIGGNVLTRKNISTTTGTCDVLDLVLDAPYYIDPAYFNADPAGRLETRWDGTTVPQDSVALGWWADAAKRSTAFASMGTVDIASSGYTRDRSNGKHSSYQTAGSNNYHGTPCASQAYGRNYGFAYNANKWYVNAYGTYGIGVEKYFDMTKLFHQNKPNNLNYSGSPKDPTVTSNSFGYRKDLPNSAYYFHRKGLNGSDTSESYSISVGNSGASSYTLSGSDRTGSISGNNIPVAIKTGDTLTFNVSASGHPFWIKNAAGTGTGNQASNVTNGGTASGTVTWTPTTSGTYYYQCEYHGGMAGTITVDSQNTYGVQYMSLPPFLSYFSQGAIRFEYVGNSMVTAGDEMIDAGVIFVCSSGNTNQKLVKYDHPDYDNYWGISPDTPYSTATTVAWGYSSYNSISRQGFPGQIGAQRDTVAGITTYRTIAVGALDDGLYSTSGTGIERKVSYSNNGNLIPFYACADSSLAACDTNWGYGRFNRYDAYYTGPDGQQSVESEDCLFSGTSSACPIACGIIATKLQYNREWKYDNVLDWVTNDVGTLSASEMHAGTDGSDPTLASDWNDNASLQGGQPIILWDAATQSEPEVGELLVSLRLKNANGLKLSGINFINT